MSISLMNLTKEEKFHMILILAVMIVVCSILQFVKVKYKRKIDNCKSKIIKKFFEYL